MKIPNKEIETAINEFIFQITQIRSLKCIILFGSYARGDFSPYSDIDLIIIGDFNEIYIKRSLSLLSLNKSKHNFEVFCYTELEFEKMFVKGNALILDAIYDGISLKGNSYFEGYKNRMSSMIEKGLKRSNCTWILLNNN
jgi:predicted nucleotidyltransferase